MRTVQLRTAKAELSKLVDEVERGDRIVITRHGRPAAVLVPVGEAAEAPTTESGNFVEFLMTIPYSIDLDEDERPRIRDVDV